MKYILPIILLFNSVTGLAQVKDYTFYPASIDVPHSKIEITTTTTGNTFSKLVYREIKMPGTGIISAIAKSLIDTTRKNIYLAYNGIKDSISQAQFTTMQQIMFSEIYPDSVNRVIMAEQWNFNQKKNRMEVEIISIAPVYVGNGKYYPLFWNRYADIEILLRQLPGGFNGELAVTAYDVFEQRLFTSHIIKF